MRNLKNYLVVVAALSLFSACNPTEENGAAKISLSQTSTFDFPSESGSDYAAKTPLTVTVNNPGGAATGKVTISIDGASANSFSLSKSSIDNIAAGGSETFTVAPVLGLEEGDYQATVHVSAKGVAEQSFGVRFVVTAINIVSISITTPPAKTEYGIGEPLDLTGLVVTATDNNGDTFTLEDVEDYLVCEDFPVSGELYFTIPSEKTTEPPIEIIPTKVQIAVGAAPVQEFEVTVLGLADRVAKAKGTTATIVLYASEMVSGTMTVNSANSDITLTTPAGVTKESVIKRETKGSLFSVGGASTVKLTINGYVTLKGWATAAYNGTDAENNNNPLVSVSGGALAEMKGHSKITGNVKAQATAGNATAGAVYLDNGNFTMDEDSQITNCALVHELATNTNSTYGGVFYAINNSTFTIKGNAKLTGNRSINMSPSGNAYAGVGYPDANSHVYMSGGEVSGNSAENTGGVAGGGAFLLVNGSQSSAFSGGIIKDNKVIYKTGIRGGSAITIAGNALGVVLSGSISISPGGAVTTEAGVKTDLGNSVAIFTGSAINIDGTLSTTDKMNVDLLVQNGTFNYTLPALKDYNGGNPVLFSGNAPANKFELRSLSDWGSSPSVTSLSAKEINTNGMIVDKL